MKRWTWVVIVAGVVGRPAVAQPALDALGDPLPPGAVARLGTGRLKVPTGGLTKALASPTGKVIATYGGRGMEVRLWDADTGAEVRRLTDDTKGEVRQFAFSADGTKVVAGAWDSDGSEVLVWDVATGKVLHRWHRGDDVPVAVTFADGGKAVAAVFSKGTVTVWPLAAGKEPRHADFTKEFDDRWQRWSSDVVFSADGRYLALQNTTSARTQRNFGKFPGTVVLWDVAKARALWTKSQDAVEGLAFSGDGKYLLWVSFRDMVSLRDIATGKEMLAFWCIRDESKNWTETVATSPDSKYVVAACSSGSVDVWEVEHAKKRAEVLPPGAARLLPSRCAAFLPDGKRFLVVSGDHVHIYDAQTGKPTLPRPGHQRPVRTLAFSGDGQQLLTSDGGGDWQASEVHTWALPAGKLTATVRAEDRKPSLDYLLFASADLTRGLVFASKKDEGMLTIQDLAAGKVLATLGEKVYDFQYPYAVFSADCQHLAMGRSQGQEWHGDVLEVATGKKVAELVDKWRPACLAFAADGSRVAWVGDQGQVRLLDCATGKRTTLGRSYDLTRRTSVPALAFSPDGRYLASWEPEESTVRIWDVRTGKLHRELVGEAFEQAPGTGVVLLFAPDGKTLAVGGPDRGHAAELWEVASGKLRARLTGHDGPVSALAFARDGRLLATGGVDTTVVVWDLWSPGMR
jgi:WD40 repeat protein